MLIAIDDLLAMQKDCANLGWGVLEVARDAIDREARSLHYVPADTIRMADDGERYVQVRDGKTAWFKAYGVVDDYTRNGGVRAPSATKFEDLAGELLVFQKADVGE